MLHLQLNLHTKKNVSFLPFVAFYLEKSWRSSHRMQNWSRTKISKFSNSTCWGWFIQRVHGLSPGNGEFQFECSIYSYFFTHFYFKNNSSCTRSIGVKDFIFTFLFCWLKNRTILLGMYFYFISLHIIYPFPFQLCKIKVVKNTQKVTNANSFHGVLPMPYAAPANVHSYNNFGDVMNKIQILSQALRR